MPKAKYWNDNVKTKEDVIRFYEIYYPEYPQELIIAIANRLENLVYKYNSGTDGRKNLTESEKSMITYFKKKADSNASWDPFADIEQEKLDGKIALTTKRLEELISE